ncbi:MAG: hypothetical protein SOU27_00560 [Sodaliphilus sp.]|nr:hypothetical protein [Sodaliphilus sp.]
MYSNNTKQVSASDHVFATLKQNGKVLANLSSSNFVSLSDVIETVKKLVGKLSGMCELNIRNKTQGWSIDMLLAHHNSFLRLGGATSAL